MLLQTLSMKKFYRCLFLLTSLLPLACKTSENFAGSESVTVLNLKDKYANRVSFTLMNQSDEPVQIESTGHFYIEKKEDSRWIKVPFIPCPCGTPCKPPAINEVDSQHSIDVSWDLVSRKCGNVSGMPTPVKTFEEKVQKGEYRMIFNVNRQKNGMRIAPEQLVVSFSVK